MLGSAERCRDLPPLLAPLLILAVILATSCSREAGSESPSGPLVLGSQDDDSPVASFRPNGHGYYANYTTCDKLVTNFFIA